MYGRGGGLSEILPSYIINMCIFLTIFSKWFFVCKSVKYVSYALKGDLFRKGILAYV